MVSTRSLAAALIITLLVSIQVSAITPDRGLENPLLLSEIGYGSLVYGSFNLDTQHYLTKGSHSRSAEAAVQKTERKW